MKSYTEKQLQNLARYGVTLENVKGKNRHEKVKAKCPYCGNENWESPIRNLIEDRLRGCLECGNKRSSETRRKVFSEEEYEYLATYKITREALRGKYVTDTIEATCPYCGNIWYPPIIYLLHVRGCGCLKCHGIRGQNTRKGIKTEFMSINTKED